MLDITFKYTHYNLLMSCPGKPFNFQKEITEKRTVKEFLTKHKKKMKKTAFFKKKNLKMAKVHKNKNQKNQNKTKQKTKKKQK